MPIRRNIGGYITANPTAPTQQAATGVWGLVQQLQASAASIWPFVRDPDFDYVSLLLPGNGTNGAQNNTFLDSSTNNFTITRNGDTTQGSFSPYGDLWSNYFDGSGDYLSVGSGSSAIEFTGAFTVECWFYLPTNLTYIGSFSNYVGRLISGSSSGAMELLLASASSGTAVPTSITVNAYAGGGVASLGASGLSIPLGTWHHVAVSRDTSNLMSIFFNGARVASGSRSGTYSASTPVIGSLASGSYTGALTGYVSNIRVVKGTAVYDPTQTTITPPTAPLTAITNTSLLTCQSNRFRDASTNNFAITVNGNTSVTNFAPFNPTAPYSAATNGGSGYFDGVDDYLSFTDSTWSGVTSATIEMWAYPLTTPNGEALYADAYTGAGDPVPVAVFFGNNAAPLSASGAFLQVGTYTGSAWVNTTGTTISLNAWTHIAAVYSSSTWKLYVNGSLIATSGTVTLPADADVTYIARRWDTTGTRNFFNGYISGLRVLKGTALYTSTFTPPTSPPTAITNTNFLANFTNAGIVDASAKNDLVTVGNAQISTAQSKFGGSSMAFDGTGDYLVAPSTPDLTLGSGDFTIEMWVYLNAQGSYNLYDQRTASSQVLPTIYTFSGQIRYWVSGADRITGSTLSANQWYHVALTRSGTSTKLFVNGTQVGATYTDTNNYIQSRLVIGANGDNVANYNLNGYIDDLRVTKGVARYTANFTPPTAPFPLA